MCGLYRRFLRSGRQAARIGRFNRLFRRHVLCLGATGCTALGSTGARTAGTSTTLSRTRSTARGGRDGFSCTVCFRHLTTVAIFCRSNSGRRSRSVRYRGRRASVIGTTTHWAAATTTAVWTTARHRWTTASWRTTHTPWGTAASHHSPSSTHHRGATASHTHTGTHRWSASTAPTSEWKW